METHNIKKHSQLKDMFSAVPQNDLASMGENLSNFKTNGNLFGYSCQQYYGSGNNEITWIFEYGDNEQSIESAFVTMLKGRFDSSICVTMRADFSDRERFIDEILKFASRRRVSRIGIESLGPHDLALPAFDNETNRMIATAYVVDLKEFDEKESLSKNHLRNVRKSEKNGIEIAMSRSVEDLHHQVSVWEQSMDRLGAREENIDQKFNIDRVKRFLDHGIATMFMGMHQGEVLTSMVMVRLGDCVYYDLGGTSPKGMKMGSSHFVMWNAIRYYKEMGCSSFNLNLSNDARPGLTRFKEGFGAQAIESEFLILEINGFIRSFVKYLRGRIGI